MISLSVVVPGGLLGWLIIVRAFRWRRYNAIHRKYEPKWRNGEGVITPEEAQIIAQLSAAYDMPLLLNYSLAFALFKTYAVHLKAALHHEGAQLQGDRISTLCRPTWFGCPISGFLDPNFARTNTGPDARPADDPRANIALARANWIHSKHQISNDDFLYTLTLFALEPARWAEKFGWRKLSPLEEHAWYIFWVEIGRRMDIKDIPDSLEALKEWSRHYEEVSMVPNETNHEVAEYTIEELLAAAPKAMGLRAFGERVVISLLEDFVRKAMIYPKQPHVLTASATVLLQMFSYFERFFLLPRASHATGLPIKTSLPPVIPGERCPRLHPNKWAAKPWYRPEPTTFVGHLRERLLVAVGWYSELPKPELKSSGYRIEEMGPFKYENDGHEEIMKRAEELQGCPIKGPWSLEGRK
ncbi:hypothetical protein D9619_008748 [Psilocybe cf. subviscida]|uniref:ER-bound oxygenase mpaB/mpaB'/Rubber oxygenase catalytic domain-containing protein n=1 Tax=Psilocybe cf. subviscida TaxID=2480587 RepID=A0A8H5B9Y7_9AGAR|nr:hypothetical protein D9619_008748 [Psilocybe cf. subviscida]